jgi:hypothetical protein
MAQGNPMIYLHHLGYLHGLELGIIVQMQGLWFQICFAVLEEMAESSSTRIEEEIMQP